MRRHSQPQTIQRSRAPASALSAGQQATLTQVTQQAWSLYASHEWAKAEHACRLILKTVPECLDALSLLGIIAAQTGRTQEAAALLQRVAARKHTDATVHNNYGHVLRDLEQHADALHSYERALDINPRYAEAHYNRAVVLQQLDRCHDALNAYTHAIEIDPHYASAHNNRGVTLRKLKRLQESLESTIERWRFALITPPPTTIAGSPSTSSVASKTL